MKTSFMLLLVGLISMSATAQEKKEVIRLSEPVQVTDTYEVFGAKTDNLTKPMLLSEAISKSTAQEQDVVIKTVIAQVCQKKGCFFMAQDGDTSARITFKDYGFFIPTDSQGKEVTILGKMTKKEISEADAKHYAEDTGGNADAIKGPQIEYSIVATSVIIQKSK